MFPIVDSWTGATNGQSIAAYSANWAMNRGQIEYDDTMLCMQPDNGEDSEAYRTDLSSVTDAWAAATWQIGASASNYGWVGVRATTDSTPDAYVVYAQNTAVQVAREDNGAFTDLGSSGSIADNQIFRVEAEGTTIRGLSNGSQFASVTDSTYASGTTVIIGGYGFRSPVESGISAFSADAISSGVVVAPSAATASAVSIAPTVRQGSVTISPAASTASAVTIAPTVRLGSLTVTPAAATASAVTVDPTVRQGSVSVAPAAATASAVTVAPTVVTSGLTIAPDPATAGTSTKVHGYRLRFRGYTAVDESKVRLPLKPAGIDSPINVGGDFTVEFDLVANYADNTSTDSDARYTNIIVDHDVWGEPEGWVIGVRRVGGTLRMCFGSAADSWATITGGANVGDGVRHRIALTRDQSTGLVTIWVDGVEDAFGTYDTGDWKFTTDPGTGTNNGYLVLGGEKHGVGVAFTGYLDELRISDVVRYTSDYTVDSGEFEPDADTMGLYHFNEGTGTTVYNRATVTGAYLANGELLVGGSPAAPTFEDQPSSMLWTWENAPNVVLGSLVIAPSAATSSAVTIDPTVVAGGNVTVTPDPATASAVTIDPTVRLGSVSIAPAAATATVVTIDPTVRQGSISVTPAAAEVSAVTIAPTVQLGSVTLTPAAADASAVTIAPAVVLGSLVVAPAPAEASAVTVDPTVISGGNISIAPDPASASAVTVDPAVTVGSLAIAPSAAQASAVTIDPTVEISGGNVTITPSPASASAVTIDPTAIMGSLIIAALIASATAATADPTVEIETPGATTTGNPRRGVLGPRTGPRLGSRTGPRTGPRWRG